MSRYTIRAVIIFGSLAIVGIITIQLYFIYSSYNQENKQLDQSIRITLQHVAEKLSEYHKTTLPYQNIIHQHSPNYYIVNINDAIDVRVLEFYLAREFETRNLKIDFEYAIYDCVTDKMVYGNYVNLSDHEYQERAIKVFPKWDEYTYYFGVYFPNRQQIILQNLSVWYFITGILVMVVLFFAYSIFIILKQKRLSEIQKDFIHNITHEFKTPLTSINLSADVLSEKEVIDEPDRIKKYASIIKEQSAHLHEQVLKVLQSSDNENLKFKLNISRIPLAGLVQEIITGFEARINREKASINFQNQVGEVMMPCDKVHLKSVIINLIDNALKYCEGKALIQITLGQNNNTNLFTIEDNGKGIDKKYVKRVFEKFFRVPTGNIHNVKGFGLGLSYVYNVVRAHGWKIQLKSEKNKGTEIQILFKQSRKLK